MKRFFIHTFLFFGLFAVPVLANPNPSVPLVLKTIERFIASGTSAGEVVKATLVSNADLIPRQLSTSLNITSHKRGFIEGKTVFTIKYKIAQQQWNSFKIVADIERFANVLVLQKDLSKDDVISLENVKTELRKVNWAIREKPANLVYIEGKQATRMVQKGRVLFESMFKTIPTVTRGQDATMIVYSKNMSITMPVTICQDAGVGDEVKVKVKYKTTDKYYTALVKSDGTVVKKL